MKKMFLTLVALTAFAYNSFADDLFDLEEDSFGFGVWFDYPEKIEKKDIEGLGIGLPVISCRDLEGASLALCGNKGKEVSGVQLACLGFNIAESLSGVQLSFVNIQERQHDDFALQIGAYNQSGKNGIQLGFINHGKNNAAFQLGLININKNGFFPVMIFVNFGKDLFD